MNTLELVGVAITAALFLGAVAVFLNGSKDKGTIETLTKNNAALNERVALLEPLVPRVESLERENQILKENLGAAEAIAKLATGITTLGDDLTDALGNHHTEAMGKFTLIHTDLQALIARGKS